MQLGISTYSFPWAIGLQHLGLPPDAGHTLLQFAHNHQINAVQFGDNLPLHESQYEDLKKLHQMATSLHIQLEVGLRGLKENHLMQYLTIARLFHSPFLRVVIDDENYEPDVAEIKAIIRNVLPHFQSAGVCLAIENHDRLPVLAIKSIIEETSPQWVGICLDTANSIGANEGTGEVVRVLAPYTLNLHIKDIVIRRVKSKMGFVVEGCAAGRGILNIPEIISQVKRWNRCGTATLELWSNAADSPEATLAQEQALVAESIAYLKNILT